MSALSEITSDTFQAEVLDVSHEKPVAIDFWATGCGPCDLQTPLLEKIANEHPAAVTLVQSNAGENVSLARKIGVQSVPELVVFRNGAESANLAGSQQRPAIMEALGHAE